MTKISLTQQLDNFYINNVVLDSDGQATSCFNFYDWFCKDSSLERKGKRLMKMVNTWVDKRVTDTDKVYVFFKNNCTGGGKLYDDFRICDLETGDVIYTVIPKCGHSGKAEVWGRENGFKEALVTVSNMREIHEKSF
jgi:hypothetical protein